MRRPSRSRPVFQQQKRRGWPVVLAFVVAFGGVTFALADTVLEMAEESPEQPTVTLPTDATPDGPSTTTASHAPH